MSDRRSYKLAPHLEVILPRAIAASNGRRGFKQGEIVQILIDPNADVRVYRKDEAKGVTACMKELTDAQIVRKLG